ncbi:MAG: hypothetical protein AAB654_02055 [Acidobacteriota bacterium]
MTSTLLTIVGMLHACNWHACFYGAFGLTLLVRAAQEAKAGKRDQAAEYGVAGSVHAAIGLLSFLSL